MVAFRRDFTLKMQGCSGRDAFKNVVAVDVNFCSQMLFHVEVMCFSSFCAEEILSRGECNGIECKIVLSYCNVFEIYNFL